MKILFLIAVGILAGYLFGQAPNKPPAPRPPIVPGLDASFRTSDGWTLQGKYMPAQKNRLALILLHGRGERKEFWVRAAEVFKRTGFGYLAFDLRGHGESLAGPQGRESWRQFKTQRDYNDFEDMRFDLEAAVGYLKTQGVDEGSIGLVGDGLGGSLALKYAAVHPKISLVVLISPGLNYEEVLTVNAMRAYKNRPVLLVYSERDRKSSHETPLLYQLARLSAGEDRAALLPLADLSGARIASSPAVLRKIAAWIRDPIRTSVAPSSSSAALDALLTRDEPSTAPVHSEPLGPPAQLAPLTP